MFRAQSSVDSASQRLAVAETRAILAKASALWAPHSCLASGDCCHFETTKRQPWLWPSEWTLIVDHFKQMKRDLPPIRPDGACPFLNDNNRCTIYDVRPFGCRTFFCARIKGPSRQPASETTALLERLASVNIGLNSDANPRTIVDWHQNQVDAITNRCEG